MKRICCLVVLALSLMGQKALSQNVTDSTMPWHWDEGMIVVDAPERAEGQQSAVGLTVEKTPIVRVGFVGLGMRGPSAVIRFCHIPGAEIVALCDYDAAQAERSQEILRSNGMPPADLYSGEKGYEALCKRQDVDLVYVATDWDHHFPVAECAMLNGKNVAIEVPSAMNLEQCWKLIDLSEKTRRHCIMLENCCYDFFEMNSLAMAQAGVFGEVVRAEGAYIHDLEPYWEEYWKNPDGSDPHALGWRLKYNSEHRGDIYSTHGLGPVAQCLDILRGDCFTTLVAMDTKSVNGQQRLADKGGDRAFRNGDHTTTLMRTANGKVVEIQHNVMTPQPYNRLFKLTGTKGYATKYPDEHFALPAATLTDNGIEADANITPHSFLPKAQHDALVQKYYHPILQKYGELGRDMGHGGMDFVMDSRLVYCLQHGLPVDIDVYDMAAWCALAELGALSMDHNSASVAFPDFTRGEWNVRKGYRHAYASAEEEQTQEAFEKARFDRLKSETARLKLWQLYDAQKSGKAKDVKAFRKARAQMTAVMQGVK